MTAPPVVQEKIVRGSYNIEASFDVDASSRAVWDVLSDYDHLPDFISGMRRSEVKERRMDGILLEQEALGEAFLVSRKVHVLLKVRETPYREISFEDVSRKDFDFYQGTWTIREGPRGLRVTYRLSTQPRLRVPWFIGRRAFRVNISWLFGDVCSEIMRRSLSAAGKPDFPDKTQETR